MERHSCSSWGDGAVLWIGLANLKLLQFLLKLNDQTLLILDFGLKMSQLNVFSLESEREKEEPDPCVNTQNCV